MGNFNLTDLAVKMYCPGNVAQLDDAGLPSLMVWIPAFRLCDVLNTTDESIHPAFIVNGKQIPGFWYSKYENVVHNGRAYSLPGEDPAAGVKFDAALECCEAKGYGWHMSTAAEWAAIALMCKKNGFQPYGNNQYGKDTRETDIKAIPLACDDSGNVSRVATGTGPLTWSHDQSMSGIWDMNGNVYEWAGGLRTVWGELQILANNDAADPDNPQNNTSSCWKAINAADGALVEPECSVSDSGVKASGSTIKLSFVDNAWKYGTGVTDLASDTLSCSFYRQTCSDEISEAAKLVLRALALIPDDGANTSDYEDDVVYWRNNAAERTVYRGGAAVSHAYSGVFCLYGHYQRTANTTNVGFRAAYIPEI